MDAASEIYTAPVFFPIAIASRIEPAATAMFLRLRWRLRVGRRLLLLRKFGGHRALTYHLWRGNHSYMLNPDLMPFKVIRPGQIFSALSGFTLLAVDGADAQSFLQSQLMNDVTALADGQWQWSGWLTPKGRVIALFALARLTPTSFLLVLPDFPADDLKLALQRFVFRAKVSLTVRDDLRAAAGFDLDPATLTAGPSRIVGAADTGYCLDWFGNGCETGRALLVLPADDNALAAVSELTDSRWLALDIARGLPRLPASQREAWTPQMLSLERLSAFSLKKGCYPGQEIVARTHYLGQAKRQLAAVTGACILLGAELRDIEGKPAGTVVSATGDGLAGLAVVASDGPADLVSDTHPVRRTALPEPAQPAV